MTDDIKWKNIKEEFNKNVHVITKCLPISNSHATHWLAQPELSESNGKMPTQISINLTTSNICQDFINNQVTKSQETQVEKSNKLAKNKAFSNLVADPYNRNVRITWTTGKVLPPTQHVATADMQQETVRLKYYRELPGGS